MLVAVDRADSPARGAHLALGGLLGARLALALLLRRAVQEAVVGEHQVRAIVHADVPRGDTGAPEGVQFLSEGIHVHDGAGPQQAVGLGVKHPAGGEVQGKASLIVHHGVAGVVTALEADYHVGAFREIVDHASLALVAPLGAHHHRHRHRLPPIRLFARTKGTPGQPRRAAQAW